MPESNRAIYFAMASDFRSCWKQMFVTDIVYKLLAFIVLTPVLGILFSAIIGLSGRKVLADEDILFFLLGPIGWIAFVLVGGFAVAILAFEQAALLLIAAGSARDKEVHARDALLFVFKHGSAITRLAVRIMLTVLIVAAPFVIAAGAVYLKMLTQFDINFYLSVRPPEFYTAVFLIGSILLALVAVLIWITTEWFVALPLLLFEQVSPAEALRTSRQRVAGRRLKIAKWIVYWAAFLLVVSTVGTALTAALGRFLLPHATSGLQMLVLVSGFLVLILNVFNFLLSMFAVSSFAIMLSHLYVTHGGGKPDEFRLPRLSEGPRWIALQVSRRSVALGLVVALVAAITIGAMSVQSVRLEDDTLITAHRGASIRAPENTMAAIEAAIEDGADYVEIDVQETADGEVVVIHDSDFKKIGGRDLKIWDATMDQLADIDIGSWYAPEFSDQRVPRLEDVLLTCKGKARVNIELKYYGHDEALEKRVVEIVEATDMVDQIVIMSLKYDAVRKVKDLRPDWTVGLLTAVAVGDLTQMDVDFLAVNAGLATRGFVRDAHNSGKQVQVWTINDLVGMSTMIGRGVDSLITDDPALARSVLAQRAEMSSFERLLVEIASQFGLEPPPVVQQ